MRKALLVIAGIILVPALIYVGCTMIPGIPYSDGHRSGVIYQFSRKGWIYKTYEGQMALGLNEKDGDGNLLPRIYEFSVSDPEIAAQLDQAEREGRRVTLHYKEYALRGCWYGNTPYDILGVE